MMRTIFMLTLFAIAIPAEANSNWERLWFNPDQRGEALLQHGDASAAAKVYKDPKRKAYAEMKAGNFKQAASDLGNLHDSDSDYNRGNALAKTGDLKGALDAYDAALKSDPNNHDARHNRDLVEKALKQQQQNKQQNGQQNGKQQDNKSGGKQGSNSGGQGSQSGKKASGANGKSGQQPSEKNSSRSGKAGGNPAGENSAAQQNAQAGASGNQAQQNPQKNPEQQGRDANSAAQPEQGRSGETAASQQQTGNSESLTGQQSSPMNPVQPPDDAAQARQDAAESLAANKNKPGTAGNESADINAAPTDQTSPLSEQQLSKEQWLRSIPDDPGGLLRRKFMIEYMLRQQKAQQ